MKKLLCILLTGMLLIPTAFVGTAQAPIEKSGVAGGVIDFSLEDFRSDDTQSATTVRFYGLPDSSVGTLVTASGVLTDGEPVPLAALNQLCYQSYRTDTHQVLCFWNLESNGTVISVENELLMTLHADTSSSIAPQPKPEVKPEPPKPSEPPQPIYADMDRHWAEYSAKKLFDEGIIVGEKIGANRYFYPEEKITRIDFLLALIATLEENYNDVQASAPLFTDEGKYQDYVIKPAKWAYEKGILSGNIQNGLRYLNPHATLNRAEVASMINRALNLQVPASRQDLWYKDQNNIPSWATEAVRDLRGYGVMKGFSDNTFHPYETVTRAEMAEVLVQLRKLILEEDVLSAQLLP